MSGLLHRPLLGGVFGDGRYSLASKPCIRRGLHGVTYMVVDPRGGAVLAVGDTQLEALAAARRVLRATLADEAANDPQWQQGTLWPEVVPQRYRKPKAPSRRRREVFERSEGRCFYCTTPLTLDGQWHVEHQLPRALGGDDQPLALVAACRTCNLTKSDRTALEFIAHRRHPR